MDRKSLIIMVVSLAFLAAWFPITNKIFPPIPAPVRSTNTVGAATNVVFSGTNVSASLTAATLNTNSAAALVTNLPPREEQLVTVENEDAKYTFSSFGGGLKRVELKKFSADVGCEENARTNGNIKLNEKAPVPALSVVVNGDTNTLDFFSITQTGDVVRAEAPLQNGLHMIKEYRLSTNYLLRATVRYENRSAQPIALPERELIIGTATPLSRHDESFHLGLEWYNGEKGEKITEPWFANKTLGCFPGTPRQVYREGQSNIVWAAVHNQFFAMIVVPETVGDEVIGRRIVLPPPTREEMANDPAAYPTPFGYQTALVLPPTVMNPNTFVEHRYDVFAGPKEFKTLQRLPRDMDTVMGFGRYFGFFAKTLLISMNGLHALGLTYGLAIIAITVIIKLLFWPLTKASTRSMKRMAALQPQMKAIQEKYKDDPRKMNQKTMEFMKENKVSPLGGCLPLLLQIPVFFGFYTMLQSAIELRGAKFLWACDLSQSDTIFYLAGFPVNPLPLLMGATMLWQARITPVSPGMDPTQQAIMKYMPLMMVVFLYNFSAGLTLYWTVQNLLSILQMKLTRTEPETGTPPPAGAKSVKPVKPVPQAPANSPKKKK
ncbi:MAG: membrane protein insertase YidC [Limisphaerales bacterium]